MVEKYYLVKKRGLGCCSMMLWDALAIVGFSLYFFTQVVSLHVVFAFLIGLGAAVALFALMKVPVLGAVLQIGMGLAWVAALYYILETNIKLTGAVDGEITEKGFMSALYIQDPVWYWTAIIVSSVVFIGLHIISVRDYHGDENADKAFTNPFHKNDGSAEEYIDIDESGYDGDEPDEAPEYRTEEQPDDHEAEAGDDNINAAMFFHGCNDLDTLNRRYRNLAKTYHPDTEAGDNDMMQVINAEYERLKSRFDK